ncbi:DNA-binding NtrC family response regulator [Undibacterium sp. GrIS 1.8]|uniref:response regulator n=1 Tax=unclassified Undibacterium TaxID=2630295 RepID=UPI00339564A4
MANILVVDDEMGIRELLSEILGDEGHVVQLAENAQQAREARAASRPDLVLLDIWMPDTDGVTLLKEWQRDGMLTMPVIMMSGHATIDTAVEATRIGALNFLEKPIALQKLLKAVQQGLTRTPEVARPAAPALRVITGDSLGNSGNSNSLSNSNSLTSSSFASSASNFDQRNFTTAQSPLPAVNNQFANLSFDLPLREARDAFERIYFEYHLNREGGSMTRVAEKTGLERTHLYRKLKQLGVESVKYAKRGE